MNFLRFRPLVSALDSKILRGGNEAPPQKAASLPCPCTWTMAGHWLCVFFLFFYFFLGPPPRHMEVPRSNQSCSCRPIPQRDLSHICDLHHSPPRQCQILNPLSEARDRTRILMDTSQIHNPLSHDRTFQLCLDSQLFPQFLKPGRNLFSFL